MTFVMPTLDKNDAPVKATAAKVFHNEDNRMFIIKNYGFHLDEMPSWVNDIVHGAIGQIGGTQRFSAQRLLAMLLTFDTISSEVVAESMNRIRMAMNEEAYSDGHIQKVAAALRCASKGITHYRKTHNVSDSRSTGPKTDAVWGLCYSAEHLETIKHLARTQGAEAVKAFEQSIDHLYRPQI